MWGKSQPLTSPQRRATAAIFRANRFEAALVVGIASPAQKRDSLRWLRKHFTRVLALVPRGSQLTTSKRPPPHLSRSSPRPCSTPTPESPGPPGLKNIVPIRSSGSLARWRISASLIVRPLGRSQSSGTRIRAHFRSGPGGSHSPQAIGAPTGPIARGDPDPPASPAESESRQIATSAAAAMTVRCTEPTTDPAGDEFVGLPFQLWMAQQPGFDPNRPSGPLSRRLERRAAALQMEGLGGVSGIRYAARLASGR